VNSFSAVLAFLFLSAPSGVWNGTAQPRQSFSSAQTTAILQIPSTELATAVEALSDTQNAFSNSHRLKVLGIAALCILEATIIAVLFFERRRKQRARKLLDERLRFETLLSNLCADFTSRSSEEIDGLIDKWMERIGQFFGVDRGSFFAVAPNGNSHRLSRFRARNAKDAPKMFMHEEAPWSVAQMRRGQTVKLTRVPDELPPEAISERRYCEESGIKSLLSIPIIVNSRTFAFTLSTTKSFRKWPEELVPRLRLMGEIFAMAVEHKIAEEEKQESEAQFRKLLDDIHVGVLVQGPRSEIVLCNPAALNLLGLTEEQLIGKTSLDPDWNVIHDDGSPFPGETHPVPQAIASRKPIRNVVMGVYRPRTGDRVWLLVDAIPHIAQDGSVEEVICTFSDMSDRRHAEEALRESQQRYAQATTAGHVGVWDFDVESGRIHTDPLFSQIIGLPPDTELSHGKWLELIHPDDKERMLAIRALAVSECDPSGHEESREVPEIEFRVKHSDGTDHWMLTRGVTLLREDGTAYRVIGTTTDITERKNAEMALRESEERYRNVVETQTELICRYLPDTTLTFVNDAYCRYFNRKREELIGRKFLEFIPEGAHEDALDHIRLVANNALPTVHEHDVIRPDGTIGRQQWIDRLLSSSDGHLMELQAIGRDVSEQRQAEQAVRTTQELLQSTIDSLTAQIAILNERADVIAANASWRRVAEEHSAAFPNCNIGMNYLEICESADSSAGGSRIADGLRAVMHGEVAEFSTISSSQVGSERRWFLVRITRFGTIDQLRLVVAFENITELKRVEESLQILAARLLHLQDEERRRLARELHDVTAQNLFAMTIDLEQLRQQSGNLSREARALLAESIELGEQALQEIRTLSYVLHPPLLDQAGLVAALRWYVDGFVKRSGINVEFTVPGDIGRPDSDIETALFRVVQESLSNIHRHSGSEKASIRLERTTESISLEIRDQGRGIPPKSAAKKAENIGTLGVGIMGMRQRLNQLNGQLEINSDEHGTTVTAIVPLA
jgi:PAS domain S-box-containing protein